MNLQRLAVVIVMEHITACFRVNAGNLQLFSRECTVKRNLKTGLSAASPHTKINYISRHTDSGCALVIGDNSRIAAGAVVLSDIASNSTAVGVPAKVVRRDGVRVDDLDQVHIPDPVAQEIARLETEIEKLKKLVK